MMEAPEASVFFGLGEAQLDETGRQTLDQVTAMAMGMEPPMRRVVITGYTDRKGSREANLALARRRAEAVADYLVSLGIARDDIEIRAASEDEVFVPTEDGASEPANRRVTVQLVG